MSYKYADSLVFLSYNKHFAWYQEDERDKRKIIAENLKSWSLQNADYIYVAQTSKGIWKHLTSQFGKALYQPNVKHENKTQYLSIID